MLLRVILFAMLLLTSLVGVQAQEPSDIIEVYGLVVSKSARGTYQYVPFVTIAVKGTSRGTYANYEGMYSIVVKKGQTLTFSAVGFAPREIVISDDTDGMHKSLTVELEPSEVNLKEVTVFPWPDRDNMSAEFLAMQPNRAGQLEAIAKDNLAQNQLLAVANATSYDSKEAAVEYLRQQSRDYSYKGQAAPQPILDIVSWGKFFQKLNKKKKNRSAREEHMINVLEGENQR